MQATQSPQGISAHRLIRRKQLELSLGISRSTIYARLDPNSRHYDPDFPKPIKLGATSIAFVESEVQEYIAHRIAESRKTVGV